MNSAPCGRQERGADNFHPPPPKYILTLGKNRQENSSPMPPMRALSSGAETYFEYQISKGMTIDHNFGYSFILFSSQLKKEGRRKGA